VNVKIDWRCIKPQSLLTYAPQPSSLHSIALCLSTKSHQTCSLFLLVQIQTQNLPLYFNSLITGRLVNSPRHWFDVILNFPRVTNVFTLHYITCLSQPTALLPLAWFSFDFALFFTLLTLRTHALAPYLFVFLLVNGTSALFRLLVQRIVEPQHMF